MALLNIVDETSAEIENKRFAAGIFRHVYKALDFIDLNILLDKLCHYDCLRNC